MAIPQIATHACINLWPTTITVQKTVSMVLNLVSLARLSYPPFPRMGIREFLQWDYGSVLAKS